MEEAREELAREQEENVGAFLTARNLIHSGNIRNERRTAVLRAQRIGVDVNADESTPVIVARVQHPAEFPEGKQGNAVFSCRTYEFPSAQPFNTIERMHMSWSQNGKWKLYSEHGPTVALQTLIESEQRLDDRANR